LNIHLITVVGGYQILLLQQMLQHYVNLGLSSFMVHVNSQSPDDETVVQTEAITSRFGIGIETVTYGDHCDAQLAAWKSRQRFPDDWFVIVDGDEFQLYPAPLAEILEHCEKKGYDHVKGCFLDRVAPDGTVARFSPDSALWRQYPVGLFLTYPVLGGDPRKVVAAKGHVEMANNGHHIALSERGCPITEYFIQVHHFKWVEGVLEGLERRVQLRRNSPLADHWQQSQTFLDYYREHGRIDIDDPRLLKGICAPDYPHWNQLRSMFLEHGFV